MLSEISGTQVIIFHGKLQPLNSTHTHATRIHKIFIFTLQHHFTNFFTPSKILSPSSREKEATKTCSDYAIKFLYLLPRQSLYRFLLLFREIKSKRSDYLIIFKTGMSVSKPKRTLNMT